MTNLQENRIEGILEELLFERKKKKQQKGKKRARKSAKRKKKKSGEKKRDRCLRIADRKFDKPSAYKSGAVVRCRDGKIWKDLKEVTEGLLEEIIAEKKKNHSINGSNVIKEQAG